jgi:small subunit ribosomal protein S9
MAKETIISGKRKTAVAKLKLKPGKGDVSFNYLLHHDLNLFHKLALSEPLRIFKNVFSQEPQFNFEIIVKGGGREAQIQAARVALSRALMHISNNSDVLRKAFVSYDRNMLVQDARRKEARKPGDSKARAKRQKSYR